MRQSAKWAVELRREESRSSLENLVRSPQLTILGAQLTYLCRLITGYARPRTSVDLGLPNPLPQSLRSPNPKLLGYRLNSRILRRVLRPDFPHHHNGTLPQLTRVVRRRSSHDCHSPKRWSLRTSRGGSL